MQENNEKTYKADEVMSMLENINGGIEVIGEQHRAIISRLDSIDGRLDNVESDIADIKTDLKEKVNHAEFEKVETRVEKLEKHAGLAAA